MRWRGDFIQGLFRLLFCSLLGLVEGELRRRAFRGLLLSLTTTLRGGFRLSGYRVSGLAVAPQRSVADNNEREIRCLRRQRE